MPRNFENDIYVCFTFNAKRPDVLSLIRVHWQNTKGEIYDQSLASFNADLGQYPLKYTPPQMRAAELEINDYISTLKHER